MNMAFYIEWLENKNTDEEKIFLENFLRLNEETLEVFYNGDEASLGTAISVINSVAIEKYVEIIDNLNCENDIVSAQVPQFSDFNDGAYRIPELLEFSPDGMTFEEIGYQLVKSPTEGAGIKYGENHSKLASAMELVVIQKRPSNVISTALGKYLIKFIPNEKNELLKRLLLRQYIIQKMIKGSANDILSYRQVVNSLSMATAIRRRNNVRTLLEFVLKNSGEEKRLSNIDWQVVE